MCSMNPHCIIEHCLSIRIRGSVFLRVFLLPKTTEHVVRLEKQELDAAKKDLEHEIETDQRSD